MSNLAEKDEAKSHFIYKDMCTGLEENACICRRPLSITRLTDKGAYAFHITPAFSVTRNCHFYVIYQIRYKVIRVNASRT